MVSTQRQSASTAAANASTFLSLYNYHVTASTNKTGKPTSKPHYNRSATTVGSTHRYRSNDKCRIRRTLHTHTTEPLRAQDPQALTAGNAEDINIYGIKEVTLVPVGLQELGYSYYVHNLRCQLCNTWSRHHHQEQCRATSGRLPWTSSMRSR
eukprot:6471763-Amphidinium_carterae.3